MNASVWLAVANFGASALLALFMFAINRTVQKIDTEKANAAEALKTQKAEFAQQITVLSSSLHDANVKLIDERFRAITHEVNNHANSLVLTIDDMRKKLEKGDVELDGLSDFGNDIKVEMIQQIGHLREHIAANFANRNDMKLHEQSVDGKLSVVTEKLATLGGQVQAFSAVTATIINTVNNASSRKAG